MQDNLGIGLLSLTPQMKSIIASNLVDFMEDTAPLLDETVSFIYNWVRRPDSTGSSKGYYDVWDIVLSRYLPTERPILFRSCNRLSKRDIQSFTGSIRCADKFSDGHKGHLLICDTQEYLQFECEDAAEHKRSYFPLCKCVKKANDGLMPPFSKTFYEDCCKEDEYIVRTNHNWLYDLKWVRRKRD